MKSPKEDFLNIPGEQTHHGLLQETRNPGAYHRVHQAASRKMLSHKSPLGTHCQRQSPRWMDTRPLQMYHFLGSQDTNVARSASQTKLVTPNALLRGFGF